MTKIMTAIIAFDLLKNKLSFDDKFTISENKEIISSWLFFNVYYDQ